MHTQSCMVYDNIIVIITCCCYNYKLNVPFMHVIYHPNWVEKGSSEKLTLDYQQPNKGMIS